MTSDIEEMKGRYGGNGEGKSRCVGWFERWNFGDVREEACKDGSSVKVNEEKTNQGKSHSRRILVEV